MAVMIVKQVRMASSNRRAYWTAVGPFSETKNRFTRFHVVLIRPPSSTDAPWQKGPNEA